MKKWQSILMGLALSVASIAPAVAGGSFAISIGSGYNAGYTYAPPVVYYAPPVAYYPAPVVTYRSYPQPYYAPSMGYYSAPPVVIYSERFGHYNAGHHHHDHHGH